MKVILFILLIINLSCDVYYLKKYKRTPEISDYYGLVVLDLIEFDDGDSIYITYNTYQGKYRKSIPYEFSNYYPSSDDIAYLKNYINCYSDSSTKHEHNETDGNGGYIIYYTWDYYYYFEFTKPNNTRYLIMGYDLRGTYAYYLYVDNTRFSRWVTTIIIVCSVVGGILLIGGIILIWRFRDSISCECFLKLLACSYCCHKTYSYDISSTNYNNNNNSDKLLNSIPSTPSQSQREKNEKYEKPVPPPEEKPIELPTSNYNPDEVPEQPYYIQDNQTQNYAPQQNIYGQNDIYANNNQYPSYPPQGAPLSGTYPNNNQYPPNPPPGEPQNDDGYNPQIYNGGGGYYQ